MAPLPSSRPISNRYAPEPMVCPTSMNDSSLGYDPRYCNASRLRIRGNPQPSEGEAPGGAPNRYTHLYRIRWRRRGESATLQFSARVPTNAPSHRVFVRTPSHCRFCRGAISRRHRSRTEDCLGSREDRTRTAFVGQCVLARVYLDLAGTVPTLEETNAFLADADLKKRG